MSENVDLVRSIFAAWERGDFGSAEWADPEIEFVAPDGPEPLRETGLAVMAESTRDFLSAWEDARLFVDEYRELDAERVLVLMRQGGRGLASGLDLGQMEARRASVFRIHDSKVTRLALYWERDRALADLGLEE
jgi:ketosteroid isomerase-like protein